MATSAEVATDLLNYEQSGGRALSETPLSEESTIPMAEEQPDGEMVVTEEEYQTFHAKRRAFWKNVFTWSILFAISVVYAVLTASQMSRAYVDFGDGNYLYISNRIAYGLIPYRDIMAPQPPMHLLLGAFMLGIGQNRRGAGHDPLDQHLSARGRGLYGGFHCALGLPLDLALHCRGRDVSVPPHRLHLEPGLSIRTAGNSVSGIDGSFSIARENVDDGRGRRVWFAGGVYQYDRAALSRGSDFLALIGGAGGSRWDSSGRWFC